MKAQSYYFSNLCSYSPNLHLPYKAYLDRLDAAKSGSDMFGGLLGNSASTSIGTVVETKNGELDLSWMDDIFK